MDIGEKTTELTERWPHKKETPPGIAVQWDMVYASPGGRDLHAHLITRENSKPDQPRPAMVFVHGGGWIGGDHWHFVRQAMWLAERLDILGLCIEYRLLKEAPYPAALDDVKSALRWMRRYAEDYNIDPERIGIGGGSAGAHLGSLALVTQHLPEYEGQGDHQGFSSEAHLGVFFNGEYDLWDMVRKGSLVNNMTRFLGATSEENPKLYDELSPLKRLHGQLPPMIFLHGTEDECVSHEQSIAMQQQLEVMGVETDIEIYEGQPHAWFNKDEHWEPTIARTESFIKQCFNL